MSYKDWTWWFGLALALGSCALYLYARETPNLGIDILVGGMLGWISMKVAKLLKRQ